MKKSGLKKDKVTKGKSVGKNLIKNNNKNANLNKNENKKSHKKRTVSKNNAKKIIISNNNMMMNIMMNNNMMNSNMMMNNMIMNNMMNNNMMMNNMMNNYMMMNNNMMNKNINLNLYNNNILNYKIKNKDKNLEIDVNYEMSLKMKESNIGNIYELSNNRIAILKKFYYNNMMNINQKDLPRELKIYSLNTFKLLSTIKFKDDTSNIIELKNKDLVRKTNTSLEFYKLFAQNYEFFQKIENKSNLILGLMNGNLASFYEEGIKIYSKEKDKYKLISNINTGGDIVDVIEIGIN